MIEVQGVSKRFGTIQAVRDVSFRVEPGEALGFLGPNGAGKTTTMRLLTGFYPPTGGQVRVAGLDVFEHAQEVRRKIGYLPENVPLYGEMTVREYLDFVAEIKGLKRSARSRAVDRIMETCSITDMARRFIRKLSKGYRQRVGLAQALIGDPEILILDEPTIGLDPRQINEIRNLIRGFAGEKTLILSTHILPEVSMICQRVVIIDQGLVVAEGSPENLSARVTGANRLWLRVGGPDDEIRARLARLSGVVSVVAGDDAGSFIVETESEVRPEMAQFICNAGWDLFEMTPRTASLEDVFLNLVTQETPAANRTEGLGDE
ncbi:MAG: ABC transporter ATP-binding protein [Proteobacteria bacterium]|nr:ABC transporter ATP-binding protein [Pseudomonadota bacterium]